VKILYKTVLTLCALYLCTFVAAPAFALSAAGGFSLIRKVPPGEDLVSAGKFLGEYTSERVIDTAAGIKVRRWGREDDPWYFDALHDGKEIKATRVKWVTRSVAEQQTIFAQLSTAGKNAFEKRGKFEGSSEVRWIGFDGRWLIVAKYGGSVTDGATLLSGIRSKEFDSAKYGF